MIVETFIDKTVDQDSLCPVHSHNYYELVFVKGSPGYFEADGKRHKFGNGDILVHPAFSKHVCYNQKRSRHVCLGLNGPELEGLEAMVAPASKVKTGIILEIGKELMKQDRYSRIIVRADAEKLVCLLKRVIPNSRAKPQTMVSEKRKILEAMKKKLDTGFDGTEPDLDTLSGQVYLSKDYLRHLFKDEFGVSPLQYLLRKRIEHAKELLTSTPKKHHVIALECGFDNEFYFSRLFRKIVGMSPTAFRSKNSGPRHYKD